MEMISESFNFIYSIASGENRLKDHRRRRFSCILAITILLSGFSYAEEGMVIKLPKPKEKGAVSLEETIKKRRSERDLSGGELTLE